MYATTFYSFKGGVGRTMALVNSGVELSRRGRRVLLVDFDLEAPGLDTFDCLKLPKGVPGIVDFVNEYSTTGQAPDIEKFVGKCPGLGDDQGEVLLMPAGTNKSSYAEKFRHIDWGDLYERRDGYLLFEDLKTQWKEVIQPDYVLIDSRTGHTDVGGICTRQLPDSVAILFFPNEQNLIGLTKVVADIRLEREDPQAKQVHLHFIMSNVPDLDDEDRILERKIKAFQKKLDFEGEPLIVHRYDSLSLLNQVVFTKDRPRSRLAGEYRRIVREIVRLNLRDREGALDYLKKAERSARFGSMEFETSQETDSKLSEIEGLYERDGEVLFHLGLVRQDEGQLEQAATLFGRAIDRGFSDTEVYLRKARALKYNGQPDAASMEALQALQADGLSLRLIRQALRLVMPSEFENAANAPVIASLATSERVELAHDVFFERSSMQEAAWLILKPVMEDESINAQESGVRNSLALIYIATGRFDLAANLLSYSGHEEISTQTAFNYAIALWGAQGNADRDAFLRVVEMHEGNGAPERRGHPKYLQCIALAYWAVEEPAKAIEHAKQAEEAVRSPGPVFSCWRYRNIAGTNFKKDIKEMIDLFKGNTFLAPPFLSRASTPSKSSQE